jgi:hypothetical protein
MSSSIITIPIEMRYNKVPISKNYRVLIFMLSVENFLERELNSKTCMYKSFRQRDETSLCRQMQEQVEYPEKSSVKADRLF